MPDHDHEHVLFKDRQQFSDVLNIDIYTKTIYLFYLKSHQVFIFRLDMFIRQNKESLVFLYGFRKL